MPLDEATAFAALVMRSDPDVGAAPCRLGDDQYRVRVWKLGTTTAMNVGSWRAWKYFRYLLDEDD